VEVLEEIGYGTEDIAQLIASGATLDGRIKPQ